MNNVNTIPALEKAIQILDYLGRNQGGATQAQLAKELDVSASTCYRILQTLVKFDWLSRRGASYDLAAGLMPVVMKITSCINRFEILQPLLDQLALNTGLAVKLSVRQGDEQVSILRAESPRPVAVSGKTGARFPLIEGSVGGALLCGFEEEEIAELTERIKIDIAEKRAHELILERVKSCREQGYCLNLRENRWNVEAMSVPIYNADKSVAAVVTLLGFSNDFSGENLEELKDSLLSTTKICQQNIQ